MVENIAIVISSHNNVSILKECMDCLKRQGCDSCNLYVVRDIQNQTEDKELKIQYERQFSKVVFLSTQWDGEAKAFAIGIKRAIEEKNEYVWLLCDVMRVMPESLEKLINAKQQLEDNFGFLSCAVLTKGEVHYKSMPVLRDEIIWDHYQEIEKRFIPLKYATFAGLFFSCHMAKKIGLPITDMKIGYDGYEYTKRLGNEKCGYYVMNSCIEYATDENPNYDVSKASVDEIKEYKYIYRNDLYLAKHEGIKYTGFFFYRMIGDLMRILRKSSDHKFVRILQVFVGTMMGIGFRPKIERIVQKSEVYE